MTMKLPMIAKTVAAPLTVALGLAVPTMSSAQSVEANPVAMKAFEKLIASYRSRPGLEVKSKVVIDMLHEGVKSTGRAVECETTFAPGRRGVVKLRGFTCYLNDGKMAAVHDQNKDAYFVIEDDGSPYYALLTSFIDMPFPELAIAFGEDATEDVLMQLHPKSPWLQPVAVRDEARDGVNRSILELKADHDVMSLIIDPKTSLIESASLEITGGDLVQAGYTLRYSYEFSYKAHDEPLPEDTFAFNPGQRQRVDLMAALPPRQVPPEGGVDMPRGVEAGALVGKPAPGIVLGTADNKAFDLEDHRGQVVVLDFWASWCGPCLHALPKLHEVAAWAREQELPVVVMTVNVFEVRDPNADNPDARLASARKTWEAREFTLPIAMDYTDQVAAEYGVRGIPSTVVIRSDGVVHAQHTGAGDDYAETLKREVMDALKAVEDVTGQPPDVEPEDPS